MLRVLGRRTSSGWFSSCWGEVAAIRAETVVLREEIAGLKGLKEAANASPGSARRFQEPIEFPFAAQGHGDYVVNDAWMAHLERTRARAWWFYADL